MKHQYLTLPVEAHYKNADNWSHPVMTSALLNLFEFFEQEEIPYCVINNYEKLPHVVPSDVDIAIDGQFLKKLDPILMMISRNNNMEIIQKIWHGYEKCAYILSPLQIDCQFRLQLDFFTDFSAKGHPCLISNEELLRNRRKFNNIYVPSAENEALLIIMRRVIKNDLHPSHLKKLKTLYDEDPGIMEKMRSLFGNAGGLSWLKLIESGDVSIFHSNCRSYRRAVKAISRNNTGLLYRLRYTISQSKRVITRLRHPVGMSVALLSPDGGGKSTISERLAERVGGSFHGTEKLYWRPHLLPPMGRLKFWNPSEDAGVNPKPHDHPQQIPIKSLVRFIYYLTDFLIGYPIKVYWQKVRKKLVVFDRYYYDCLVDMHRYRFNLPRWLPRLVLPIVPSPDMTIYLDAEPEELLRRKQELPLHELKRQVEEFRQVIGKIPRAYSIKTCTDIEDIVKEVSYLVLTLKSDHTKNMLG